MASTMRPAMRESTELIIIIEDSGEESGRENLFLRSITGTSMERTRINPSAKCGPPASGALYFIISLTAATSTPNSLPESVKRTNWKSGFEYFDLAFFIAARLVPGGLRRQEAARYFRKTGRRPSGTGTARRGQGRPAAP